MDLVNKTLTVATFNCKHFRDYGPKFDFINELSASCDIIMLQEHCLYQSEFYKLAKIGNGSDVEAVSAMDENVYRTGRPFGGCAIVWNPKLQARFNVIKTGNNRLVAVTAVFGKVTILLLNVYMPCDGRDYNSFCYKSVLDDALRIINSANASHVIFGGDFNTDLSRNSTHVREFMHFVTTNCFSVCIDNCNSSVPYTFISDMSTSRIDHFIVSDSLKAMCNCKIIDNHLHSDHVPVILTVDIDVVVQSYNCHEFRNAIAWHKITNEDVQLYQHKLDMELRKITIDKNVTDCRNVKCTEHCQSIELLYCRIINACCVASQHFPVTDRSKKKSKCIPGWNAYVEGFRKEALSWHHIWKAQGKPHVGDVADMHRFTRAKYHKAVKYVKQNVDKIKMEKMADAIVSNNSRNLWQEVKKIKGSRNLVPACIDGINTSDGIAQMFSDKYNDLYNSVPYDIGVIDVIKQKVNNMLESSNDKCYINIDNIVDAIKHLKCGKSGGQEGIFSNHIIYGTHLLNVMLCLIFNTMLIHGYSPNVMLTGLLVPIPKDSRKSLCSSDNYRAIALNSILCKILDLVILCKESQSLLSSNLQFGFKNGLSTTHCTFLLQETVSYYNYNHTNVYTLLLDASKAFDRVKYCKLFEILLERKMSPITIRLLLQMYTNQQLMVQWGNVESKKFNILNGVKQGGVLSPVLFAVYIDGLLLRLKQSGIGCCMSNKYVGALSFADDITLLCPTYSGLCKMVNICEVYAADFHIKFNGKKSKLLIFKGINCNVSNKGITVGNDYVLPSETATHLGHKISVVDKDSIVNGAKADFWCSFNIFLANFGHLYSFIKNKLFVQYCCYFYGAPLWNLYGEGVNSLCVAWRKALRNLWGVHWQTHCNLITGLSQQLPLQLSLETRFCKFINKCLRSENDIVKSVANVAIKNPFSNTGKNFMKLYSKVNNCLIVRKDNWFNDLNNINVVVSVICELISIREGHSTCDIFSLDEVKNLLDFICIS